MKMLAIDQCMLIYIYNPAARNVRRLDPGRATGVRLTPGQASRCRSRGPGPFARLHADAHETLCRRVAGSTAPQAWWAHPCAGDSIAKPDEAAAQRDRHTGSGAGHEPSQRRSNRCRRDLADDAAAAGCLPSDRDVDHKIPADHGIDATKYQHKK